MEGAADDSSDRECVFIRSQLAVAESLNSQNRPKIIRNFALRSLGA